MEKLIKGVLSNQLVIGTLEKNNIFYTSTGYSGGISDAIPGNYEGSPSLDTGDRYKGDIWSGCTLPNCVGMANGAFNELCSVFTGVDKQYYTMSMEAKDFINAGLGIFKDSRNYFKSKNNPLSVLIPQCRKDKYDAAAIAQSFVTVTDIRPPLGSVMVWGEYNGNTQNHVAVVCEIIDDDTVVTIESNYYHHNQKLYEIKTRKRGTGTWGTGKYKENYFGCIVNPYISPDFQPPLILDVAQTSPTNILVKGNTGFNSSDTDYGILYYVFDDILKDDFSNYTNETLKIISNVVEEGFSYDILKPRNVSKISIGLLQVNIEQENPLENNSNYKSSVITQDLYISKPVSYIQNKRAVPKIYDTAANKWITVTPCIRYDGGWYKFYNTGTEKVDDT